MLGSRRGGSRRRSRLRQRLTPSGPWPKRTPRGLSLAPALTPRRSSATLASAWIACAPSHLRPERRPSHCKLTAKALQGHPSTLRASTQAEGKNMTTEAARGQTRVQAETAARSYVLEGTLL